MKTLIIIPTYNEIDNISAIITAIFEQPIEVSILIVDDSSPDGTAQQVRVEQKKYPNRLFLEIRLKKEGLGPAYMYGFEWAIKHEFEAIFEMDADFSHQPKTLPLMIDALKNEADVIVGSRYIAGVNVVNWPMGRVLLSYFASVYVKLITGMKIQDPTAGFVGYKKEVIELFLKTGIRFKGYGFQIELKHLAWQAGFRIKEVTNIFINRKAGESKMSSRIIWEALLGVIYLRIKRIFVRIPKVK